MKEEPSRRVVRVQQVILAEVSRLARRERALEQCLVTFTAVDLTPDLKQAFVYWSTLARDIPIESIGQTLDRVARGWQNELGRRLAIKYTPRLTFRFDEGQERGDRVMAILRQIESPDDPLSR
ncbi:MAG: ribosome-binding factor A [Candidatus Methylacidiphilales bacterium]